MHLSLSKDMDISTHSHLRVENRLSSYFFFLLHCFKKLLIGFRSMKVLSGVIWNSANRTWSILSAEEK